MPKRYEIAVKEAPRERALPNKFKPVVDRFKLARMLLREALHYRFNRELLFSRPCIYGVFGGPVGGFWPLRRKCVGCMRCVLEYPDMCRVLIDERWKRLGDSYFDPDSVSTLDFEATTGKIMVKGVGFKGRFSGEGFDSMWTDMSEIVRPTRDGIYGREYISTAVDIGRKPARVGPDAASYPVIEAPLPIIFDDVPEGNRAGGVTASIQAAAARLGTLFVSDQAPREASLLPYYVPRLRLGPRPEAPPRGTRMIEFEWDGEDLRAPRDLRESAPGVVLCARLPLNEKALKKILALYHEGVGVFHLGADYHGREIGGRGARFIKDAMLDVHNALVRVGVRDEITLIASGGIVRAEHVPKIILCGADLVALDTPVLAALGAEFHGEHAGPDSGALRVPAVDPERGTQRLVNLCAAWRDQMLEIVSAMGLRDVRRMRGETGRAIFYEDLEKEWLKI